MKKLFLEKIPAVLLIYVFAIAPMSALAWTPPIGIPDPAESWTGFGEIDQATPSWPASWLAGTPSATAGYYYVDPTVPGASNSGNTYGHPGFPRTTPPEGNMTGASMIYIHAGTFSPTQSGGDRWDWSGTFTAEAPLWITGNPSVHPVITDDVQIGSVANTSYVVFENFDLTGAVPYIQVCAAVDGHNVDHILLRNIVRMGTGTEGDAGGVRVGLSQTTDIIPTSLISHVVGYNLTLGNMGSTTAPSDDTPGFYIGYHTEDVWIVDSTIFAPASDSVAGSHYNNLTNKTSKRYYIGRNTLYGGGENGIDLKVIQEAVISENHIYGPFGKGAGTAVILHYGANSLACTNVSVINNRIHTAGGGITMGGSFGADSVKIIGNLIYDIHVSHSVGPDPFFGNCIQIGGANGAMYIVDNTFYDYDEGIAIEDLASGDTVKIHGNIFGSVHTDAARYEIKTVNGQQGFITMDYNLYPSGATFFWASGSRNLTYMQATALQEAHAVTGAPLLDDPSNGDFSLTSGSAAIGASVEGPVGDSVYTAFMALHGTSAKFDFTGIARPNDTWEIGAFEYVGFPTISSITDQNILQDTSTTALPITIGDVEDAAGDLVLSAVSDNPTLINDNDVVWGGSGANRTGTWTPNAGQTGSATIIVTVTDSDDNETSVSFTLNVASDEVTPPYAGRFTFRRRF